MDFYNTYSTILAVATFGASVQSVDLQWKTVFEAFSSGDGTAYSLFVGNSVSPVRSSLMDKEHFKDQMVENWEQHNITLVEMQLILAGVKVAHVLFNGIGTTKTSWMNAQNVMNSSYGDLTSTSTYDYFSIEGHQCSVTHACYRRFYINHKHQSCDNDAGWIGVLEGEPVCPYETTSGSGLNRTVVGYINKDIHAKWSNYYAVADSLRITVAMITEPEPSDSVLNCSKICLPCKEGGDTNLSVSELQGMVKQLQKKLKVDKGTLSSSFRRLNSAHDSRTSATALGATLGGVIFGLVFGFIVLPDIFHAFHFLYLSIRSIKQVQPS